MGEAELNTAHRQIIIRSDFFFYGDAADAALSAAIANDIENHWNEANGITELRQGIFQVLFQIGGYWSPGLTPEAVFENTNCRNNYFRIEAYSEIDISFVDAIGSNTGYFKLDNLFNNSTTAAHEYGHTLGLMHPAVLDIRGEGEPGIMYPRGAIVDPVYQYNPSAAPLEPGGTINPFTRKVQQKDIDNLRLKRLSFNKQGFAMIGDFSSVWHEKHLPGENHL